MNDEKDIELMWDKRRRFINEVQDIEILRKFALEMADTLEYNSAVLNKHRYGG
jgi:hypothetical protein